MAKVEIKQPIVDEIAGYLADAQAMVLVDYRGLTVEEDTQLRKALREAGVDYKVYKNTLIKRAVKGTVFEAVTDLCEGPTAIATSASDATAPARVLYEAAKKMPNLELKGGVVDLSLIHIYIKDRWPLPGVIIRKGPIFYLREQRAKVRACTRPWRC